MISEMYYLIRACLFIFSVVSFYLWLAFIVQLPVLEEMFGRDFVSDYRWLVFIGDVAFLHFAARVHEEIVSRGPVWTTNE